MQPTTFAIVKKNYATGKASVMTVHTDKMNARFDIESFVVDYIVQKDGQDDALEAQAIDVNLSGKVLEKREFARAHVRDNLPEGHYIVVHCAPERDGNKMTIWRKYSETTKSSGFWSWWGSTQTSAKWRKVLSMHIVVLDEWKPSMPANTPIVTTRRKWRTAMRIACDVNTVDLGDRKAFSEKMVSSPAMQAIRDHVDAEDPLCVTSLRAMFPDDFTRCPGVEQPASTPAPAPAETAEEDDLRASILQRCTQVGDNINIVETA